MMPIMQLGDGMMHFHLEFKGSFDAQEVLYVVDLKNLLTILVMEDKDYAINFKKGHVYAKYVVREWDDVVPI